MSLNISQLQEYAENINLQNYLDLNSLELFKCINKCINQPEKWDILEHTTNVFTLESIFKDKVMKSSVETLEKYKIFIETNEGFGKYPAIYFTYVFQDLIYFGNNWAYGLKGKRRCIICVNTKILKDLPSYICNSLNYGKCHDDPEQRIKNLSELKNHINSTILKMRDYKNMIDDKESFNRHHEILIDKVPIKYITGILVHKDFLIYVTKLVKKYKLKIKVGIYTDNSCNYKEIFESIL